MTSATAGRRPTVMKMESFQDFEKQQKQQKRLILGGAIWKNIVCLYTEKDVVFPSLIKRQKKDDRSTPLFNSHFLGVTNLVAAVLQTKQTNIYFSIFYN
jgi:hypothetical protein